MNNNPKTKYDESKMYRTQSEAYEVLSLSDEMEALPSDKVVEVAMCMFNSQVTVSEAINVLGLM